MPKVHKLSEHLRRILFDFPNSADSSNSLLKK
jgi:hypothetical protein